MTFIQSVLHTARGSSPVTVLLRTTGNYSIRVLVTFVCVCIYIRISIFIYLSKRSNSYSGGKICLKWLGKAQLSPS